MVTLPISNGGTGVSVAELSELARLCYFGLGVALGLIFGFLAGELHAKSKLDRSVE